MLPSPAISPSPQTADEVSLPNRKRQRSRSMDSEPPASSSSPKRAVMPDATPDSTISNSNYNEISSLSPLDDIDLYMKEQGEQDVTLLLPPYSWPNVPPEEKFAFVDREIKRTMQAGETWYLISGIWWGKWRKACTSEVDKGGPMTEEDLGPVDNSFLLDSNQNLKISLVEGIDVYFVPLEVWNNLVNWYGSPNYPLPRQAISRGLTSTHISLELYPPSVNVYRLATTLSNEVGPYSITVSVSEKIPSFTAKLSKLVYAGSRTLPPFRVWRVYFNEDEEHKKLDFLVNWLGSPRLLPSDLEGSIEDQLIHEGDNFVVEFKEGGNWIYSDTGLLQNPRTSFSPAFTSSQGFFNRMSSSASSLVSKADSYRSNSPFSGGSWKTVSHKPVKPIDPGTLGLGNLGNTCFMNSALQCLAHNQELSDYFLTGLYREELNLHNPLGMGGAIAEAFGELLQKIWCRSGFSSSYSPREFKSVLQRFAPQFSGYQQHDSQELVAFLLDGLHEDLNRVLKKPYVEKPDWEGGGDFELVKLAQKSWDGYKLRNDSVIVDLFQGQYQSTLVCPECQKVSITFDPFMYLTLPLPIQKKWSHTIYYIPWDLDQPHIQVPLHMSGNDSFKDLRNLLGRWMNAPAENLLTLEIFNHRFYKNLDDSVLCGDMLPTDIIVCFELPCHARQSPGYTENLNHPFLIPIYLVDAATVQHRYYTHQMSQRVPNVFGYPAVIPITREESANADALYYTILNRVQRWTKHARDFFQWEETSIHDIPLISNDLEPAHAIAEIKKENEEVLAVETMNSESEGTLSSTVNVALRRTGMKRGIFNLHLQCGQKDFGTGMGYGNILKSNRSWESRLMDVEATGTLLREGDILYCEFDENMKAYYFGEEPSYDHALWDTWETFEHPEFLEQKAAESKKRRKALSLQDCLEEFTKEEKLGEHDLWYCPQCKKHQQATKKIDLWNVPDILVVHLKRFSNNRRDKVEVLIDFPVEGLDLSNMVGERAATNRLLTHGVALEELVLGDSKEPLLYDLIGVDEHLGGLGGGHYRAFALNHVTKEWYHFDDSYVVPAKASEAVNSNAYLLFYRRRSTLPLGGKSHHKIQEARLKPAESQNEDADAPEGHFYPTPPSEDGVLVAGVSSEQLSNSSQVNLSPKLPSPEISGQDILDGEMNPLSDQSPDSFVFQKVVHLPVSGRNSPASNEADPGDFDDWGHNSDDLEDTTLASSGLNSPTLSADSR